MTREEAINKWVIPAIKSTWKEEKCEEIIEALEQEPCIQEKQANADKIDAVYIDGFKAGYSQARFDLGQKPCEDAVSRSEIINRLKGFERLYNEDELRTDLIDMIWNLPFVSSQEPKTGHWIYDDECHEHGHCSECGYSRVDLVNGEPHNFCRRCGAKMVELQESE